MTHLVAYDICVYAYAKITGRPIYIYHLKHEPAFNPCLSSSKNTNYAYGEIQQSKKTRVSDPHWFNADPDTDPDPAFFLIADPDPIRIPDPDPGSGSRDWWPKIEKNL